MISIFGVPSLSKDSSTYKAISPFNNSLSKCFFISYIISPFFSFVHILVRPSIRGWIANELIFDNISINYCITLFKFSILKDFVKATMEAINIASLLL